jgi:hypothetical protein
VEHVGHNQVATVYVVAGNWPHWAITGCCYLQWVACNTCYAGFRESDVLCAFKPHLIRA